MKNIILTTALILFSLTSYAQSVDSADTSKTLVCLMGDIANMDIVISSNRNGNEKVQVMLFQGMSDDADMLVYENSNFKKSQLSKSLKKGSLDTVVSTSDLYEIFGGAYLNAGMLKMTQSKEKGRYDVLFAAENTVYTANCGEVK